MKRFEILLAFGLIIFTLISHAQSSQTVVSIVDTSKTYTVPLEEIPTNSLQTITKLDKLAESLISQEEITKEKFKSDSILSSIETLLIEEENIDYDSLLSRKLVNKSNFWGEKKYILDNQINRIENIIFELSSKSKLVNNELKLWINTKSQMDSIYTDAFYFDAVDEVIFQSDSLSEIILDRTKYCFSVLKQLNQYKLKVDSLLSKNKDIKQYRQENIFEKTYPSFSSFHLLEASNWNLREYVKLFRDENKTILVQFYQSNNKRVILFIAYLILLIGISFFLKKKSKQLPSDQINFYQSSVATILNRPISVAFILGIFTSGLFFRERPPILVDISILVLTISIIGIVAHVSNKRSKIFLYVFALLILLRFVNYIFPPATSFHRLNLLLMGGLELVFLILLFGKLNIKNFTNSTFNQFVRVMILFHIFASITGLISNFTGQLRLAEIAIDLSITNTLVGFLLIIFTVVIVGVLQLAIDGRFLRKFNFIQKRSDLFKRRIAFILMFVVSLLWINYILQILRVYDIFYRFLGSVFNTKISLGSTSFSMGSILLFFFIIWLSVIISDMIKAVLEDDVLNRISLKKGLPRMISVIVRFSLITIGIFLAVSAVGMPLNQLTIIISAFSVGIGFGLQNIVNNFVSGVILLFERPVQLEDTVEVNNLIGRVKSMGIRSSNIRTFDGAEVIVPNANLISNEVINWTLSDKRRRIEIFSGVAYGSDVYKVKDILLQVLNQHPDILKEPEPLVLFNDLGESSLDFRLLFWTDNFDKWIIIKSEVIFKIHDALYEANITIPFPQRDLHIKSNNTDKNE